MTKTYNKPCQMCAMDFGEQAPKEMIFCSEGCVIRFADFLTKEMESLKQLNRDWPR